MLALVQGHVSGKLLQYATPIVFVLNAVCLKRLHACLLSCVSVDVYFLAEASSATTFEVPLVSAPDPPDLPLLMVLGGM